MGVVNADTSPNPSDETAAEETFLAGFGALEEAGAVSKAVQSSASALTSIKSSAAHASMPATSAAERLVEPNCIPRTLPALVREEGAPGGDIRDAGGETVNVGVDGPAVDNADTEPLRPRAEVGRSKEAVAIVLCRSPGTSYSDLSNYFNQRTGKDDLLA